MSLIDFLFKMAGSILIIVLFCSPFIFTEKKKTRFNMAFDIFIGGVTLAALLMVAIALILAIWTL